jgi:hypothetical protein
MRWKTTEVRRRHVPEPVLRDLAASPKGRADALSREADALLAEAEALEAAEREKQKPRISD